MNKPVSPAAVIHGEEHWTNKGSDVRLFLWEKHAGDPAGPAGTILFVHGSSMGSQPTFDLQVPGRPDSSPMDYFARRATTLGASTWKATGDRTSIATSIRRHRYGADDLRGRDATSRHRAASAAHGLRHLLGRAPRRPVRPAPPGARRSGWRSTPSCGRARGRPTLAERRKKLPEFRAKTAGRSTATSCARSSTRDHPARPTTSSSRRSRTRSCPRRLDADRHLRRHVRQSPGGDPEKITVPTLIMRGQFDGIASLTTSWSSSGDCPIPTSSSRSCRASRTPLPPEELPDRYHVLASFFASRRRSIRAGIDGRRDLHVPWRQWRALAPCRVHGGARGPRLCPLRP